MLVATNMLIAYIRYADDFVVLADTKEKCEQAKIKLEEWLRERGLEFA